MCTLSAIGSSVEIREKLESSPRTQTETRAWSCYASLRFSHTLFPPKDSDRCGNCVDGEDEHMSRHYSAALGMRFRWFVSAELLVLRLKCLSEMSTFTVSLANGALSQTAFLHHLLSHSVCVSALERKWARDDGSGVIEYFGSHR